jgi:hypothetical protein
MKKMFLLFFMMTGTSLAADYSRHMVMLNESGFGGYASYEHFSPRSGSIFKEYNILDANLELNYTYSLDNRWQLGGFFANHGHTRRIETNEGRKGKIESDYLVWGLNLFYNFSDDLPNSWLVGGVLAYHNQEEEFDKNIQDFLEDDRQAVVFELVIGKRFSLKPHGLANISYSPSISGFITNSTKDYEDDKINLSYGINLHFIKFDILF